MPVTAAQFIFYAGKGGVGKTTCAAAAAVGAAARGDRVLVVSTDPAHSLGDVLGMHLGARPRRVRLAGAAGGNGAVYAAEIDARRAFARWLAANRPALAEIIEHGTWLDGDDVAAVLGLSIPGIDELVGLVEIGRMVERPSPSAPRYDRVVVDTAPTGHALRLLAAPETVAAVARALDSLQEEHRFVRSQLARIGRPEAADRLIELLAQQAHDTARLLRDSSRARLHWVTVPEQMSLSEAEDGIRTLEQSGIPVGGVVINRAIPGGARCAVCDRRRIAERTAIDGVRRRLGRGRVLYVVPAEMSEPRGVAALRRIAAHLAREANASRRQRHPRPIRHGPAAPAFSLPEGASADPLRLLETFANARLLFFGGKGGVGKTTVAATVAVRLARADPRRPVLLLSSDPAHSLGDVFGQPIGDRPIPLRRGPRNLRVREVDAAAALLARRAALEAALNEIGAALGVAGLSAASGGQGVSELMELAPPGVDELFGLISVVEAQGEYPLIVMDTAPTGHALRLLEMPDAAREWVQVILRILLKYRAIVKPRQLASELVELSKSIGALQMLLRNPVETHFAVVTRAAALPRLETGRLLTRLRRLRLATPVVVVNAMTLSPDRCPRCRSAAVAEQHEMQALRRLPGMQRCVIIQTPLAAPPPRGAAALERWGGSWDVSLRARRGGTTGRS